MEEKITLIDFILAQINYEMKNLDKLTLNCEKCPLRAECRKSAEMEEYEDETCGEFLARMIEG